jgi:hypothetical protein
MLTYEALRLKNRRALALLESWSAEPDDLGNEWWEDFLKDIDRCRLQVPHRASAALIV